MAYSRAELLQVVCAIAGRPVEGQPGTWPESSDVVEEAAALLAEVDHRWEVYMGARTATDRPRLGWGPACVRCGHVATLHNVDDEERRECMSPDCGCRQYECATVQP